jgi:hypothetical protein
MQQEEGSFVQGGYPDVVLSISVNDAALELCSCSGKEYSRRRLASGIGGGDGGGGGAMQQEERSFVQGGCHSINIT